MAFQIPKASHPWRQYANKSREAEEVADNHTKPLKQFMTEIITAWDSVEITTTAYGINDRFKLGELPDYKAAAWLSGILKRHYARY